MTTLEKEPISRPSRPASRRTTRVTLTGGRAPAGSGGVGRAETRATWCSFRMSFSSNRWYGAIAMKRHTPTVLLSVLAFALIAFAQAQEAAPTTLRLAFVDTQALIRSHPADSEIQRLGQALETELGVQFAQL